MAEDLVDGEFWLPPQFLADDDFFLDKSEVNGSPKSLLPSSGYESFGFASDLSSPVESVVDSTDTESDEEDYLLGLSRQMARYTLDGDIGGNNSAFPCEKTKDWVLSSSPESTLCFKQGPINGGSNCQSGDSSPPGTRVLPCSAVAGEAAARVVMSNEESKDGFNGKGLVGPAAKNPSGLHPHQSFSNQKVRPTQLQQSQLMKPQHNAQVLGGKIHEQQQVVLQKGVGASNYNYYNNNWPLGFSPSGWPPLHQQQQPRPRNGSAMRAVFLGNPNGYRECAGTGVFLPRPIGTPQPRKKQGCSTVLVPARVVEALNLNLDEINAKNQFRPRFKAAVSTTDGATNPKQRKSRAEQGMNHEIRLPQEWTY